MTSSETTFNDEELIARLRSGDTILAEHYMDEAADRIEALTDERDWYMEEWVSAVDRLNKAVEALEVLIQLAHDCEKELTEDLYHVDFCGESEPLTKARATLAEISSHNKGESHE